MKTLNSDHTLHCAHKNCTVISWCVSFECVEASNTEKAKFVGSNKIQRIASRSWLLRAQAVYSSDPLQTLNWMHLIDFTGFCHIQHDGIKSRFILLFTATDLLEDKSRVSHLIFVEIPLHLSPFCFFCNGTASERELSATLGSISILSKS